MPRPPPTHAAWLPIFDPPQHAGRPAFELLTCLIGLGEGRCSDDRLVLDLGSGHSPILAFDRASIRIDADGRLHVSSTPISKATVNSYWGSKIPNFQSLQLDPTKQYRLLRNPGELAKAAQSFNGLPLLATHQSVSSDNHAPELVVGSTGTEASFEAPYLMNSLVVWTSEAISDIEDASKRELSCGYRYRADMRPGTYQGEPYDGIMRDIVGNHVALAQVGRAGPEIAVPR